MATTDAVAASSSASTVGNVARTKLNANFDTFIKLLTTQLQYQDPLKPMDTTEFTNQLVLYSQVEQQLSANDKLDALVKLQQGQGVNAALGYLGWEVSAQSNNLPLQGGQAKFHVDLESQAAKLTIGITDPATGKVIRGFTTETGTQTSLDIVWDGKDNNGNVVPDGAYKISLLASASDNSTVKSTAQINGLVTGVDLDENGNTVLNLGGVKISPSDVRSVHTYQKLNLETSET